MRQALLAGVLALGAVGVANAQGPYATDARSLNKGTKISATLSDSVSSRINKIGDMVSATITNDVKDASGNIVFPAGSPAELRIIDIKAGDNKSKDGALAMQVATVKANGRTYYIDAKSDSINNAARKPGWTADKKKIGLGAAAGAVVGGLVSGNLKGALAGGILGAAGGAVVAHEMNGRDVYLEAGSNVDFVMAEPVQVLIS
jgi:hypothetical protein